MRSLLFAKRVSKEILRDPLSYIFCVATPLGMLLLFFLIYQNMPAEAQANMQIFRPDYLSAGIVFFGFSFVMLFGTLVISRDRDSSFAERLCTTPMTAMDFLGGYFIPLFLLGLCQCVLGFALSAILGAAVGAPITLLGCLRATVTLLPALFFFIGCGLLFGAILSETASPGICSVLVTLSGLMGGVWMPLDTLPKLEKIFAFFPFSHMVSAARNAMLGTGDKMGLHIAVSLGYAVVICVLSMFGFRASMRRDAPRGQA